MAVQPISEDDDRRPTPTVTDARLTDTGAALQRREVSRIYQRSQLELRHGVEPA